MYDIVQIVETGFKKQVDFPVAREAQFAAGYDVTLADFLENLFLLFVLPGSQAAHMNEVVRYAAKGGEYNGHIFIFLLLLADDACDILDPCSRSHRGTAKFHHNHKIWNNRVMDGIRDPVKNVLWPASRTYRARQSGIHSPFQVFPGNGGILTFNESLKKLLLL